ncbi:MerR family transcriptional regulator [Nisaea sp.]|uniref:MerR family transcriptional regulator n=1 Tax=Nisaea sp. TaxID=2024842 RepID=UPI0032ED7706
MAMQTDHQSTGSRRNGKSASAFRTISEVADDLEVPPHVLRFWETKFSQVRPLKRGGGRRYYRPEDVELLRRIRALLYQDGYTIKGVQKLLKDGGARAALRHGEGGEYDPEIPGPSSARTTEETEPTLPLEAAIQDAYEATSPPIGTDALQEVRTALGELQSLKKALDKVRR